MLVSCRTWRRRLLGCWLCATLAYPNVVQATTARRLSLQELVERADVILLGTVRAQQPFWQGARIFTLHTLSVAAVWGSRNSSPPSPVQVLTLGGVVGDIGQRVDGSAVLRLGQRYVLHLKQRSEAEYTVLAMGQGAWWVDDTNQVSRPGIDQLIDIPNQPSADETPYPTSLKALQAAVAQAWPHAVAVP